MPVTTVRLGGYWYGHIDAQVDVYISSFVKAWQSSMRIHETMAENRLRFANRLNEMSEELLNLSKQVDKNRKSVRILYI
jgi:Rho GTPase-activating protein RGD1